MKLSDTLAQRIAKPGKAELFCLAFFLLIHTFIATAAPDFPTLSGRVVDQANLLSTADKTSLEAMLEAHENETSNQVVVVTVNSLQGYSIADYANRLGRQWGIGQAEKDNGVVLLVAPDDRKVRIEVGYGLEGALTDANSSDIIRAHILPAFREDDYPGGIIRGTENILKAIQGEYTPTRSGNRAVGNAEQSRSKALADYFPLVFIGLLALAELLKRFGKFQIGHNGFPAAFAGIVISAMTQNLMLGIVAAAVVLILLMKFNKGKVGSGRGRRHGRGHEEYRNEHRSRGSGGGFSGGGGSFGGGGSSGSW